MYFEIVHVTGNSQCAVATIGSEWSAYAICTGVTHNILTSNTVIERARRRTIRIKSHNFVVRRKKDADNDEDFIPFFWKAEIIGTWCRVGEYYLLFITYDR